MLSAFCLHLRIFTLMKKIYTNVLQIVPMRKRGYRQIKLVPLLLYTWQEIVISFKNSGKSYNKNYF